MTSPNSILRVRINQIDHTLSPPGALDNSSLPQVPIIRIYGLSSSGQKACVHLHQVYPYFYIEYHGEIQPDRVNRYITTLTQSLNYAIAISAKRNPPLNKSHFVRAIILVKGVHFYGFHSSYSPFLKIFMNDPAFVNRAITLMQSGTIMQTRFRVYESHLSFLLQFMCDFGLYGCGWIELGEVWERGVLEKGDEDQSSPSSDGLSFPKFKPSPYFRQSRMPLEVDAASHQILNRHLIVQRDIHHELSIPSQAYPPGPLVLSVRELWEDERRRRAAKGLTPSPDIPVDLSESSRGKGGEWVAEARWWEDLRRRIENERTHPPDECKENKDGKEWEKWVMTTFESAEALWEKQYRTWKPVFSNGVKIQLGDTPSDVENPFERAALSNPSGAQTSADNASNGVDVDEQMLSSQEISELVEQEEEEWERLVDRDDLTNQQDNEDGDFGADDPLQQADEQLKSEDGSVKKHDPDPESDPFVISDNESSHVANGSYEAVLRKLTSQASSVIYDGPVTPTKSKKRLRSSSVIVTSRENKFPMKGSVITPTEANNETEAKTTQIGSADERNGSQLELQFLPLRDNRTFPSLYPDCSASMAENSDDIAMPSTKRRRLFDPSSRISPVSPSDSGGDPSPREIMCPRLQSLCSEPSGPYVYSIAPPTAGKLVSTIEKHGLPSRIYRAPFYSKEADAPERPREYAGLLYNLKGGEGLDTLEEWQNSDFTRLDTKEGPLRSSPDIGGWEYTGHPPSVRTVKVWLKNNAVSCTSSALVTNSDSQIAGPTQRNMYGFKTTLGQLGNADIREKQSMTILSCEIFALSNNNRLPDTEKDEVVAVFYSVRDASKMSGEDHGFTCESGAVVVNSLRWNKLRLRDITMDVVGTELDLLNRFVDIVMDVDPDIVVGWEVQAGSWGYLNSRCSHYGLDLPDLISRAPARHTASGVDQWGIRQTSTFKVCGRHVLNVWRIMRAEHNLTMYTFENVVFHVLRRRIPKYTHRTLATWFTSEIPVHAAMLFEYFSHRTAMVLQVLDATDVITKTAEFARVFGVDFFSVISRGSQFKVESFMLRIAKPECFVLLSPSKQDVGKQNAAECMPLIMEPLSAFYNSPLLVLDFQSLYPSIMIAYNYCYSTCLGRVSYFKGRNKFGVTDLQVSPGLLASLKDHIHIAPNGIIYVKSEVRRGLLGRMLTELLETRVMVKQAMKGIAEDKALRRVLDARQLGLKYICNVTYGYTSATYSGRMPAVEIADSIVQSGRETLEKAVRLIDSTSKWGAKVVYGDTDSLFVYLKEKTKEQAFRIGYDIAKTITALNPAPIKLKFEKVYLPCVLMAKKRYVGFKYETPDESEPVFDAKGIETVRRDGVLAQRKMTEMCLKLLFRTQDLSQVKDYCTHIWLQILENNASLRDFIFAKEVRMGTYSDKVPPPPGVTVAARRMLQDNNEPQYGDRLPYVIVRGPPNTRLVDRAVDPLEFLEKPQYHLDAHYYISRVLIPPLERIFNLVGADVRSWYEDMPKALRSDYLDSTTLSPSKTKRETRVFKRFKIDEHFQSSQCIVCGAATAEGICHSCLSKPQTTTDFLSRRIQKDENRLLDVHQICRSCTSSMPAEPIQCESLDCPWFFQRKKAERKVESSLVETVAILDGLDLEDIEAM